MASVAIICEYNPFHTGHAYHIRQTKKACDADTVIGIMSGCFVQRAEPAVLCPETRATAAIYSGMDCVVELPTVFSCAAGNTFARGAIKIISDIPSIKYLSLGAEDDGEILQRIAKAQSNESDDYKNKLQEYLSRGLPYAVAVTQATKYVLTDMENCTDILSKPNNILAIEYLKAIFSMSLDIKPIFVKRRGNGYNDDSENGEYISATAARKLIRQNSFEVLKPYIAEDSFEAFVNELQKHPVNRAAYNALTINALRTFDISSCLDAAEGLEHKLKESAEKYCSLDEIFADCKSKRYTMSRIKRICLQALLGITEKTMSAANDARGRLIALKNTRKDILKSLTGVAIKNTDYARFGADAQTIADSDGIAGGLYSLITARNGNSFWDRKLLTV